MQQNEISGLPPMWVDTLATGVMGYPTVHSPRGAYLTPTASQKGHAIRSLEMRTVHHGGSRPERRDTCQPR
jgi:hypothetical protein